MGNFRDNRGGGGRDFGRRNFNDRGSDRPTMHKAICSKCGKECEVPFRPTGSKPVFCRDCFKNNGGGFDTRRPQFDNRNDDRGRQTDQSPYKDQFVTLHAKLDKILKLLTPVVSQEIAQVIKKPQEEQATNEIKEQPEEQTIAVKKKKVSKKTTVTSEE